MRWKTLHLLYASPLVLAGALAGLAVTDGAGNARALGVTRAEVNPEISDRALAFVRAQSGSAGVRRAFRLSRAPTSGIEVLGLAQPRRHVVLAGVQDTRVVGGKAVPVLTLVTMVNGPEGYRAVDSWTTCDPDAQGVVFSVPRVGSTEGSYVVALGSRRDAPLPLSSDASVVATAGPMQAWMDPQLDSHDPSTVHLGTAPPPNTC